MAVKEKGPFAHFSVCLSCIPFNSSTSKCVDNTTSLKVSSSLHVAAIALLWEAFTNVSDKIRISPFTARFLCLHRFIKPCRTGPARLCKACRAVRVYTDITNRMERQMRQNSALHNLFARSDLSISWRSLERLRAFLQTFVRTFSRTFTNVSKNVSENVPSSYECC